MIFLDSNVPMYLVGASHPHKADARHLLEVALTAGERIVTDAEVLQEILHRYVAIDRRDAIQLAFDIVQGVVDEVYDVTMSDVERAKAIVLARRTLSARDAIHAAIMGRERIVRIMSFDSAFDELPGITRLGA